MKNQAVIDIEDYYSMRKRTEELQDQVNILKVDLTKQIAETNKIKKGLIIVATNNHAGIDIEPPFRFNHEGDKLIITFNKVGTPRFKDVELKTI